MPGKLKAQFLCQSCGSISPKWLGQCPSCKEWNSLIEEVVSASPKKVMNYAGSESEIAVLDQVELTEDIRIPTNLKEFDHVLGGGLVSGSVILMGGDPGIGKSTILLQAICELAKTQNALYVTGEESPQQVAMRAKRLQLPSDKLLLLAETQVEKILKHAKASNPKMMVIDSIQTVFSDLVSSAPGSVSQVRESAAQLVRYAKQNGVVLFLIGHVTKEGTLAGPRVLEHMVDTVLYFEGQNDSRFRVIRAVKNRFGAVNELGVFAMTDRGLSQVANPSAIFLSRLQTSVPGNVIMVTWEGTRPLLVEVQALVDDSHLANPRRLSVGLEQNRLAMLLAVLSRHGGLSSYNQDVFVNVVGGLKVLETGADCAILLAVASGIKNKPIPQDLIVFGEVGLGGEIRPVPSGQERLREAVKHGFKTAIIPKANVPKASIAGLKIIGVDNIQGLLAAIF